MHTETPALSEKQMAAFLANVERLCKEAVANNDEMKKDPGLKKRIEAELQPGEYFRVRTSWKVPDLIHAAVRATSELDGCEELIVEPAVESVITENVLAITRKYPGIIGKRKQISPERREWMRKMGER